MTNNKKIENIIKKSVMLLFSSSANNKEIQKSFKKHQSKIHVVPIKYRVLNGILQSLNIKFGNFLEVFLSDIVKQENSLEIIEEMSNNKNVSFPISDTQDDIINRYISKRQELGMKKIEESFKKFQKDIIDNSKNLDKTFKSDVDVLFKDNRTKMLYYVEVKYNDDHDTGKYENINKKALKTYVGLLNKLGIKNISKFRLILYYFNNKFMKGNIYLPEKTVIYRGESFFKKFFTIKYQDVDRYLSNIGESKQVLKIFDDLYKKIRNMKQ